MMRAMPPQLPDAVLFDNDGLLLDTESVWTRAERDMFERRGLEFTDEFKREIIGTSAAVAGELLERGLGEPGRAAELIEELNELVVAELEHGVEAMVGARDLLERLKAQGPRSGSSPTRRSPSCCARWRSSASDAIFDVVISAHEVAAPKPAPIRTWRPAVGSGSSRDRG